MDTRSANALVHFDSLRAIAPLSVRQAPAVDLVIVTSEPSNDGIMRHLKGEKGESEGACCGASSSPERGLTWRLT